MLWLKKATAATVALAGVFALGLGVGVSTHRAPMADGQEKGTRPGALLAGPKDPNQVAELQEQLANAEKALNEAVVGLATTQATLEVLKIKQAPPVKIAAVAAELEKFKLEAERAKKRLIELSKRKAQTVADDPAAVRAKEKLLEQLKHERLKNPPSAPMRQSVQDELKKVLDQLKHERKRVEMEQLILQAQSKELQDKAKVLQAELEHQMALEKQLQAAEKAQAIAEQAELDYKTRLDLAGKKGGFVELTVRGTDGEYYFEIRETNLAGKPLGTVTVKPEKGAADAVMLARLLQRLRTDKTAPQELRVIVEPQTTMGYGARAALKACDTAGFKSVKFTGYVFGGGFAQPLKPGQKGDTPGYTYLNAIEKSPPALIEEIEEGMRRF